MDSTGKEATPHPAVARFSLVGAVTPPHLGDDLQQGRRVEINDVGGHILDQLDFPHTAENTPEANRVMIR